MLLKSEFEYCNNNEKDKKLQPSLASSTAEVATPELQPLQCSLQLVLHLQFSSSRPCCTLFQRACCGTLFFGPPAAFLVP
jgi:hypothetical protein